MKRLLFTILLFMVGSIGMSQSELNNYKYIIVPKKFDVFKKQNQHQTSTLIKYLLDQKGFEVVYDDDLPLELFTNRCLGLTAVLNDNSSLFTTKVVLDLKDCMSQTVFSTVEGKSKEKNFKTSFNEAIRDAFNSFDGFLYEYNGKAEDNGPITLSFKDDVKKLNENSGETSKLNKTQNPMVQQKATLEEQSYKDLRPVESNIRKMELDAKEMIQQEATKEAQSYTNKEPLPSDIIKGDIAKEIWYAQELSGGYQLVDSTPKIRMKLLRSSIKDVYHAQAADNTGMVYIKDGKWWFEYYEDAQLITQELNIKF